MPLSAQMTVFKYIEDKDVFQKFYSKMLARRLIYASSASDDAEANMISRLKEACGTEYTSKLQKMFQDIALCKDLNEGFKEHMNSMHQDEGSSSKSKDDSACRASPGLVALICAHCLPAHPAHPVLAVDFHVLVLGTSSWPLSAPVSDTAVPVEMQKTLERFKQFYSKKYSGRKITWLWNQSRNELRTSYLNLKYTFLVSSYQACILLQFNGGSDALSYAELSAATQLSDETLKPQLTQLVKQKVLTQDDDTYELNFDFKSKKVGSDSHAWASVTQIACADNVCCTDMLYRSRSRSTRPSRPSRSRRLPT